MTARFLWKQRESLRRIEKRARETADPVERLRYVRNKWTQGNRRRNPGGGQ